MTSCVTSIRCERGMEMSAWKWVYTSPEDVQTRIGKCALRAIERVIATPHSNDVKISMIMGIRDLMQSIMDDVEEKENEPAT